MDEKSPKFFGLFCYVRENAMKEDYSTYTYAYDENGNITYKRIFVFCLA